MGNGEQHKDVEQICTMVYFVGIQNLYSATDTFPVASFSETLHCLILSLRISLINSG